MKQTVVAFGVALVLVSLVAAPMLVSSPTSAVCDVLDDQHDHGADPAEVIRVASGADLRQPAGTLSAEQIADAAYAAGWRGADVTVAVAVALAESAGDPSAVNPSNADGSIDRGLMQINSVHAWADPQRLLSVSYNMWAAHRIWREAGDAWTPWVTFNEQLHLRFMPAARRARLALDPAPTTVGVGYGRPTGADSAELARACAELDAQLTPVSAPVVGGDGAGRPGSGEFPPEEAAPWSALRDRSLYGNGWGGASINMLDPRFARQLALLERHVGQRLQVSSGYRTAGYQAQLCQRVSGPCAPPGRSLHQQGLAADTVNWAVFDLYLERFDLCNNVAGDAIHISAGWGARPCA